MGEVRGGAYQQAMAILCHRKRKSPVGMNRWDRSVGKNRTARLLEESTGLLRPWEDSDVFSTPRKL